MKRASKTFVRAVAFFLLLTSATLADDNNRIWKGEVKITFLRMGHYEGSNTDNPQITANAFYDEHFEAKITIKACVNEGSYTWVESNDLFYKRTDSATWEKDHKLCLSEDRKTNWTAWPGDSWEARQTTTGKLDTSTEVQSMISLIIWPNGNYILNAGGGYPYQITQHTEEKSTEACSGETKKIFTIIAPGLEGGAGGLSIEGGTITILGSLPLMPSPLMVIYQGKVEGNEITGNSVLFEKTEGAGIHKLYGKGINEGRGKWHEKMLGSWHFSAANPCDQVVGRLQKAIAILAAFHDTTLLLRGQDIKTYLNEVYKLAAKIYQQSIGSSQHHVAVSDMGVDKNCKLQGEDAFKDTQKKSCSPELITKAILTHEMTHVKQCNNSKALFIRGFKEPQIRRKFEIEAYCSEIEMFLSWLDKNCGNDLSKHKDNFNSICK